MPLTGLWLFPQTFIDMEGSGFSGDMESLRVSDHCQYLWSHVEWAMVLKPQPGPQRNGPRLVGEGLITGLGSVP